MLEIIAKHFLVSIIGIVLAITFLFITSRGGQGFNPKLFFKENGITLLITVFVIALIFVTAYFVPSASDIISTGLGIDVEISPEFDDNRAALNLGILLYEFIRRSNRKIQEKATSE